MKYLEYTVIAIVAFTVIYMIFKVIDVANKNRHTQPQYTRPKNIEIISRDLYMRAENLIATHDVYTLQLRSIDDDINSIENKLQAERHSMVNDKREIQHLIKTSLTLQEKKCNLEKKCIKIMEELDNIAKEEYRRQLVAGCHK